MTWLLQLLVMILFRPMVLIGSTPAARTGHCRCGHAEADRLEAVRTEPSWCAHCGCSFFEAAVDPTPAYLPVGEASS